MDFRLRNSCSSKLRRDWKDSNCRYEIEPAKWRKGFASYFVLPGKIRLFRYFIFLMVFLFLFISPIPGNLQNPPVSLLPPGLRSLKDPSIIVPAVHRYLNQPPAKPVYRNESGKTAKGWAEKFVDTRRFSSDGSAWIYYRISNLADSETVASSWSRMPLRVWPAGATIVLESYRGSAAERKHASLIEIVVIRKTHWPESALSDLYYPANWNYARYTPKGELSNTPQKIAECHRCHSIAFHLTGDLVFTQFP